MKRLLLTTSAASLLLTGPALAQSLVDRLVAEYQDRGFTYIEVSEGPTQIKVEATQGDQTIEVIYDAVTAEILDYEVELADADDARSEGVEYDRETEDFTFDDDDDDDDDRRNDDDDDDDGRDNDEDDDDDDDDDDGTDDDDDDDDEDDDDDSDDD